MGDFTNAVKSFALARFIIKKLNNNNYNKCIIYKSPVFVHRIYTYKHYSTFIGKTKIRHKNMDRSERIFIAWIYMKK